MEATPAESQQEKDEKAARKAVSEMKTAILVIGLSFVFVCVTVVVIFLVSHFRIN